MLAQLARYGGFSLGRQQDAAECLQYLFMACPSFGELCDTGNSLSAGNVLLHAVRSEAQRRPKDFHGLECGLAQSRTLREATYAMNLHAGGPALATGGIWTALAPMAVYPVSALWMCA